LALVAGASLAREDAGDLIRRGKKDLAAGRVVAAESTFARAAAMADGDERSEALFLQAGVVRSGAEAEALYRRLLDEDPDGDWSEQATLELAKIEFATGRYEGARGRLRDGRACERSEEACLFEGMAAVMLEDFDGAIRVLERVRRGRAKTWAALSLAEAEEGAGRGEEACRRYESLARARVNPAAWYRYAECLEQGGDAGTARREYEALAEAFAQTPEAIRAAEKLSVGEAPRTPPEPEVADEDEAPRGPGYTVQFGSFTDRANAIKLAARIKKTYPGVRIDSELVNYREVFRVRIGHYPTRGAAQSAGESMARELDESFTIMPVLPTTHD
jgi:tetratricopeptide (TPR) repeat protein